MRICTLGVPLVLVLAACNKPPEGHGIALDPVEPTTLDDLVVSIQPEATDPNGNDVVEYRYVWSVDGSQIENNTETTLSGDTRKGQEWTVRVTPWDGKASGTPQEATVTVLNTAPTADVTLSPDPAGTLQDVESDITTHDIDSDQVTLRYEWRLNGSVTSLTADTLRANRTTKGEVWEVSVFPSDDEVEGDPAVASITIANTAPEVVGGEVTYDTIEPTVKSTLSCEGKGFSDIDDDDEGYTLRWFVNDSEVATSQTLAGQFVRGDTVTCELTPFDGEDSGAPVMSKGLVIRNAAPSVDAVEIGPEDPTREDTVTATMTGAVDADGDEVTFLYSWRVDSREAAASADLPSSRFRRDQTIQLVLTPTDGSTQGDPITSNQLFGGNNVPVITKLTVTPDPLYTDAVAEATVVYEDFDGDEVDLVTEWYVNGSKISPTTATIDGKTWFTRGDELYVIARPDDGADKGAAVTSAMVKVVNSPPTAPVISIDPTSPKGGDDVHCKIDTASTDADGDDITYTFEWEVNGKVVTGDTTTYTGDTLSGDDWVEGNQATCFVTPDDGRDDGPVVSKNFGLYKGQTGSYGVVSGNDWKVCRVGATDAWFSSNTSGQYNLHDICKKFGYTKGADKWGGTCGTVCGYCGKSGDETFDNGGLSGSILRYTVHWRCAR